MSEITTQLQGQPVPQAPEQPKEIKVHILSQEEKNDLRKKVLAGQPLTLEQARDVVASIRQGSAAAVIASATKVKRGAKKQGMSDQDLDKDLDSLL